jgi:MFS family permease
MPTNSSAVPQKPQSIFTGVTPYHWAVVILASMGWLFDCMGQRIFVLARQPAIQELLGAGASDDDVKFWGGMATCILMLGWGAGGILFGMMSDRYGRVKAMLATLLAYTLFSGLSGLAGSTMMFLVYRFLCGMGVGGMFGAATTLVAESVPPRFRTWALGSMQALSALGNITGASISLGIGPGAENYWGHYSGWQVIFFVSVFPIVLGVPILTILKEPEAWIKAKQQAAAGTGKTVGSMADLFRHPRWRHNTFVGICLGVAGMVGLWGIGFFSPELITTALKNRPLEVKEVKLEQLSAQLKNSTNSAVVAHIKGLLTPEVVRQAEAGQVTAEVMVKDLNRLIQGTNSLYSIGAFRTAAFQGVSLKKSTLNQIALVQKKKQLVEINFLNRQLLEQIFPGSIASLQKAIDRTRGLGTMLQDVGSLTGMFTFTFIAAFFNRRKAFLIAFTLCLVVVSYVFYSLKTESDVYWMLPMLGFVTLSVFAGFSIYFPELFPTRLRGTGVGFCYNTVRFIAAPFPFMLGALSAIYPFRTVAVAMCAIYLLGIVALIWAPETKGQPLPED